MAVVRSCVPDTLGVATTENDDGIGLFFGVTLIVEVFSDSDAETATV